jgi:hypothetical protein
MTEGCVLENHRARAGDLARDRESLNEAQHDQQSRCEHTDLLVRRQKPDGESRDAHQDHATDEYLLAAVCVPPMPEDEGAHRPGDVAHAVRRERPQWRR